MKTDKFTQAEIKNRPYAVKAISKILKDGYKLIETNPDAKTRFDFYILTPENKKIFIEHKHRGYYSTAFPDWQLDGNKYDYLHSLGYAFYINTFADGKFAIWDMRKEYTRRWSKPHNLKTVANSPVVRTYDVYLTLNAASYVGTYEKDE